MGTSTVLTGSAGAGAWSSSNTAVVIVGSSSGSVIGVSSGTTTISYSPAGTSGCGATTIVTVNAAPAITGITTVCSGTTTALTDASAGGVWAVVTIAMGTVSATGVVTGIGAGITMI